MENILKKIASLTFASMLLCTSVSCSSAESSKTLSSDGETLTSQAESGSENDVSDKDTVITMATIGDLDEFTKHVLNDFNEADNGYTIVIKDYKQSYTGELDSNGVPLDENGYDAMEMQLTLDLSRDGGIDLVSPGNIDKFYNLARQGAFVDLYQFMADDSEVNRATLNENIMKLFETDGKLYSVPIFYSVNTLAGPTKYVGEKENWTVDDMISHWEQAPEDATISGHRAKNYVYMSVLRGNLGAYYDFDKASASFDSPEFIRILDFCNSFAPVSYDKEEIDYDKPTFITSFRFGGFDDFHFKMWYETKNGTEPYTIVGYPSEDGNGSFINADISSFGICSYSSTEVQEGAWQFVRMFMTEEYINNYLNNYQGIEGFPINNKVFEQKAQKALANNKEGRSNIVRMNGVEYDVGYLTQEEYDLAISVINGVNRAEALSIVGDSLWDIINDEIDKLFDGTQNAETTAETIQNRALILLSERQ